LGDLPIAGEDQASIRDNIEAWVRRFGLADAIRLNSEVTRASRIGDLWVVDTPKGSYRARNLIAATGAHNRPWFPSRNASWSSCASSILRRCANRLIWPAAM
jgi:cation diffusion facilitator CzcD-associated flavoprotein CzcO